jgi:cell division protein FtsB
MYWLSKKQAMEVIGLVIGVYIVVSLGRSLWQLSEAKQRLVEARQRVDYLQKENDKLENNLDGVRSDTYVEKVARDRLNMQLPGETVVVIQENEGRDDMTSNNSLDQEKNSLEYEANWQKWMKVFGWK